MIAANSDHGVQLKIEAPVVGVVGNRIELRVGLRNVGDHPVRVRTAGECESPVAVGIRPAGSGVPAGTEAGGDGHMPGRPDPGWNGDPRSLPQHLRMQSGPRPIAGRSEGNAWSRSIVCPAVMRSPMLLEVGAEVLRTMTVDLRWGLSPIPTEMELVAASGRIGLPTIGGLAHSERVTVTVPFTLDDDPRRQATIEKALAPDGIPAAPTLSDWLDVCAGLVTGFNQSWYTDLAWWQGRWELWIDPAFLNGDVTGPLRIRWDADRERVTDVRTVAVSNGASSDDPDAPKGCPPDDIRYQAN